jgi:hypothetical protein
MARFAAAGIVVKLVDLKVVLRVESRAVSWIIAGLNLAKDFELEESPGSTGQSAR